MIADLAASGGFSAINRRQTGVAEILPQSFPPVGVLGTLQPRTDGPKMREHFLTKKIFTTKLKSP